MAGNPVLDTTQLWQSAGKMAELYGGEVPDSGFRDDFPSTRLVRSKTRVPQKIKVDH